MVCLIGNEADKVYMFLIGNEAAQSKSEVKMAFTAIQRRNSWTSGLNMQEMQA